MLYMWLSEDYGILDFLYKYYPSNCIHKNRILIIRLQS